MPSPPSADALAVRPADASDRDVLAALEATVFGPSAWSVASIDDELASDHLVLAADAGSELIGWAVFSIAAETADLRRIAVRPERRRQGVAAALLAEGLAVVARRRAERVLLEVEVDNGPAVALYEAWGFAVIARRNDYYGVGRDALVMERPSAVVVP